MNEISRRKSSTTMDYLKIIINKNELYKRFLNQTEYCALYILLFTDEELDKLFKFNQDIRLILKQSREYDVIKLLYDLDDYLIEKSIRTFANEFKEYIEEV